jgi:hypothetical protein
MALKDVRHTVRLGSDSASTCVICGDQFGQDYNLASNHYLQAHSATLLHVGSEAYYDGSGKIAHATVMILAIA